MRKGRGGLVGEHVPGISFKRSETRSAHIVSRTEQQETRPKNSICFFVDTQIRLPIPMTPQECQGFLCVLAPPRIVGLETFGYHAKCLVMKFGKGNSSNLPWCPDDGRVVTRSRGSSNWRPTAAAARRLASRLRRPSSRRCRCGRRPGRRAPRTASARRRCCRRRSRGTCRG